MWSDPEPSPNWIDGNFCLKAGWLIDGKGTPVRRQQCIYVHSGTIKSVVSSPLQEMGDESIIDCSHATILPLLMDAHVHLALSGTTQTKARQSQLSFERDDVYTQVAGHLEAAWQNGVVAVREAGDHNGHVHTFLHGKRPESLPPVDSVLTRWGWHAPGRYGSMIARQPDPVEKLLENAEPDFTVMDHVKIIQSGINSIDVFGKQNPPQFSEAVLSRLTAFAHARHIKVMVHANGVEAVRIALAAGCDSIEHGYFMGEANLRQMADSGTVWVPTLIPMAALTKLDILSPKQRDIAGKTLEHQMDQISQAVTLGVTIGLGTDAGSIGVNHGSAVREELELLIESGLTLEQAIQCATVHNAVLMGRSQSGAVAKGNLADLLIIPGPPEDVISKMCGPLWKCRKGKWHLPD